jgi:hypothetical protein
MYDVVKKTLFIVTDSSLTRGTNFLSITRQQHISEADRAVKIPLVKRLFGACTVSGQSR